MSRLSAAILAIIFVGMLLLLDRAMRLDSQALCRDPAYHSADCP